MCLILCLNLVLGGVQGVPRVEACVGREEKCKGSFGRFPSLKDFKVKDHNLLVGFVPYRLDLMLEYRVCVGCS